MCLFSWTNCGLSTESMSFRFTTHHIFWAVPSHTLAQLAEVRFPGTGSMTVGTKTLCRLVEVFTQCPLYCLIQIGLITLFLIKVFAILHPYPGTSVPSGSMAENRDGVRDSISSLDAFRQILYHLSPPPCKQLRQGLFEFSFIFSLLL